MRVLKYLLLFLPAVFIGASETPTKNQNQTIELLHTEVDAVGWVFDALLKYSEEDRPFVRFVYLPPWADKEWIYVTDVAMNLSVSQSPTLVRGDRHAGGWILGYNFKFLVPDPILREEALKVWDSLAQRDYVFHLSEVNIDENGQKNLVVLAPHLKFALAKKSDGTNERIDTLLVQFTQSTGSVYRADFLLEQLLTSKVGKYPEFRQLDRFKKEGKNQLNEILADRGYFFNESLKRHGEKGSFILRSGVTGKNRIIIAIYGLASRSPLVMTFDTVDLRTESKEQFIRNLLDFLKFYDANEIFVPLPNGLVEYLLTNAEGEIQRVAPPDVAADTNKPKGFTQELEMGMSCIICHFPNNGYNTNKNDLEYLVGSGADPYLHGEVFYDTLGNKITKEEAITILAARYGERLDEPDGVLGRAKRDFVSAINHLTDYTIDGKESAVQKVGEKIKKIYHSYRYQDLDPEKVCLELGVKVPKGRGKEVLKILHPSPKEGELADPLVEALKKGLPIKRDDMASIYGELAIKAMENRQKLVKK